MSNTLTAAVMTTTANRVRSQDSADVDSMSLLWFQRNPLPTDRMAQREVVAGFDA